MEEFTVRTYVLICVKHRTVNMIFTPLSSRISFEIFVMFFQNFSKASKIQILVILYQYQTKIIFRKGKFEIV